MIELADVTKTFTLHQQGGQVLAVIRGASFRVDPGECVALTANLSTAEGVTGA